MDVPTTRVETRGSSTEVGAEVQGEGQIGIALVAEGKAAAKGSIERSATNETSKTFSSGGLQQVVQEIGGSGFVLFADDFHYIPKAVQTEIGKQIPPYPKKPYYGSVVRLLRS
jgi:hypothetical protein